MIRLRQCFFLAPPALRTYMRCRDWYRYGKMAGKTAKQNIHMDQFHRGIFCMPLCLMLLNSDNVRLGFDTA